MFVRWYYIITRNCHSVFCAFKRKLLCECCVSYLVMMKSCIKMMGHAFVWKIFFSKEMKEKGHQYHLQVHCTNASISDYAMLSFKWISINCCCQCSGTPIGNLKRKKKGWKLKISASLIAVNVVFFLNKGLFYHL